MGLFLLCSFNIFTLPIAYASSKLSSHRTTHSSKPQRSATPNNTISLYEFTTNGNTLYNQGCNAARGASGLIILDWGEPLSMGNGVYGTYDFGGHGDSNSAISAAMTTFARGVWSCRTSSTNLAIGIGNSNYYSGGSMPLTTAAWYAAGQQWGQIVNNVQSSIANAHYNGIEGAYGAGDIETEWASFSLTSSFVQGYNAATSRLYFDFGDDTPGHWSYYQVWYVAYGAKDSQPIPEIYYAADATQDWEQLSIWACNNEGSPIVFRGAMSTTIGNSPSKAFNDMYAAEASNSCTAKALPWLNFSTKIQWG